MRLGPKRCPARFAFLLEHPLRQRLLRMDRLIESLRLQPRSRILDLGAGGGVVAAAVAKHMQDGELILLDPQFNMLKRARQRVTPRAGMSVELLAAVAEHLPLRSASVDLVLLVTVLGEVDDSSVVLQEVHRVLRPAGVLSISEHLPDPDFRSLKAVRTLVRKFGFEERETCGGRWSYTINFVKNGPS